MARRWLDPPRYCTSCGKLLVRGENERRCKFTKRHTCDRKCGRRSQADYTPKTYGKASDVPAAEFTCSNCNYFKESVDFGRHCGVCDDGSEFRMAVKRPKTAARNVGVFGL